MNKILLVFDYFKEAFHLNKQNKALYTPQIALIAVRVLIIVFAGIGVYNWIGLENINNLTTMRSGEIFRFILGQGLKVIALLLIYSLIAVFVEAGLLNMYKKAVMQGYTESGDFKEGVSKYFLKLLAGEILIVICYILASPFYLLIGLVTLTVGLTLIPLLAGIFLSMWKVSLVMNDKGIFASIGDSFGFAKRNFMPLALLQIIHFAFIKGASGSSGGGGSNFNFPGSTGNTTGESFFNQPAVQQGLEQAIRIFKIVIAILIPVVAIATIGASVVLMIFEVFFSLALFIAYKNDFRIEEIQREPVEASNITEEPTVEAIAPSSEIIQTDEINADNEEVEQ